MRGRVARTGKDYDHVLESRNLLLEALNFLIGADTEGLNVLNEASSLIIGPDTEGVDLLIVGFVLIGREVL